jgi:sulfur relay (sulfurtransferase) complex TusBCD TusD component (DsrE family)
MKRKGELDLGTVLAMFALGVCGMCYFGRGIICQDAKPATAQVDRLDLAISNVEKSNAELRKMIDEAKRMR